MTELRRAILRWYDRNARDLPWRASRDPYSIWISEVMLQQTQVETVKPYYKRFLAKFPSVTALANAKQSEVLREWEGLGYYRRARQLHTAAQVIRDEHNGDFPTTYDSVLALPGIGRYTAGAVLSIAFDQRLPILEGNTIRVYSRLLGYRENPRSTDGQRVLWDYATRILPRKRVGAFNQAMMELGSEVCFPRDPNCEQCPLVRMCIAREKGWQATIPAVAPKVNYEDVHEAAVIVTRDKRYLIRQCGDNERWAGLWDFPRFESPKVSATRSATNDQRNAMADKVHQLTGIQVQLGRPLTTIKHAVTRFRITLTCYGAAYESGRLRRNANCRWVKPGDLANYPLSVTGRKLARLSNHGEPK